MDSGSRELTRGVTAYLACLLFALADDECDAPGLGALVRFYAALGFKRFDWPIGVKNFMFRPAGVPAA